MEVPFANMGASVFSLFVFLAALRGFAPPELLQWLLGFRRRIFDYLWPYLQYEIHESVGVESNIMYNDVKLHLSALASLKAKDAEVRCLSLAKGKDKKMSFDLSDASILEETFKGAKFRWTHRQTERKQMSFSYDSTPADERWWFLLTVHKRDAKILDSYLSHISFNALTLRHMNTERKIYTNIEDHSWRNRNKPWQHATFRHPSTFDTMALDPQLKQSIIKDLDAFLKGKDFYNKTGRAWKRGYLLHGPPGTGKSSLVGAIANYTGYDVYDLELTEVNSNNQLRKLLMKTDNKSIILIEDIDCTIKLENRVDAKSETEEKKEEEKPKEEKPRVTLSGLLNFIDGIWSACGEERLIIFTTNHPEKLDPALVRAGRMDMHILMSYCRFPAFKILASRYLGVEKHDMFDEIASWLEVTDMTPAEIAEILCRHREDVDMALSNLISALKKAKEEMELQRVKQEQAGHKDSESAEENKSDQGLAKSGASAEEEHKDPGHKDSESAEENKSDQGLAKSGASVEEEHKDPGHKDSESAEENKFDQGLAKSGASAEEEHKDSCT